MTTTDQPAPDVVGPRYRRHDVEVRGGTLRVGVWEPDREATATVVAVHGITSSHLTWPLLARALPDVRIVAPDLRGRGRSRSLPGPYGMPSHADDVAAVMDALDVEHALLVGHSMGAFVSVVLADRHPERVTELVLVDGGMPLLPPAGASPDDVAQAVLGPAAARLQMEFATHEAYRDFFREHPAFAGAWTEEVAAYVDYDLEGEPPHLRPATTVEALQEDIRELVGGDSLLQGLSRLRHDATWIVAPRGLLNEVPPLYPDAARAHWLKRHPQVQLVEIPDVNHYTVVMGQRGVEALVPHVRRALERH